MLTLKFKSIQFIKISIFEFMEKKDYILSLVKQRIANIDPNAKIYLFGSRARNDARNNSDWDFLILTDFEVTRELKNKIIDQLFETELNTDEILTGIVQNVKVWKQYAESPLYKNIQKDGVEI